MFYKCVLNIDAASLRIDHIYKTEHYGPNTNCKAFLQKDWFYNFKGYGFGTGLDSYLA